MSRSATGHGATALDDATVAPSAAPARMVVAVPARLEAELLPGCLDALERAAAAVDVPVTVVVAVDTAARDDGTLAIARSRPVVVVETPGLPVGAARHRAVAAGLRAVGLRDGAAAARTWLATTDADSVVPPGWLGTHLGLATAGADLVLGTVDLPATAVDHVATAWRERYARLIVSAAEHPHVHGANLGVRVSSYLAAGGFPAVAAHEDVLLARAVRALGACCVSTTESPVTTSERLDGRADEGVSADLVRLTAAARAAG